MNLYCLNQSEIQKMQNSIKSCTLRKLEEKKNKKKNFQQYFKSKIIPVFKRCYGNLNYLKKVDFCDNTISAFFDYTYNNNTNNKIGKCGYKTAKFFYDYCIEMYDDILRGLSDWKAFTFVSFFKTIFKYMKDAIAGTSKLKMIMLSGHDSTIFPLLNFFNGLNIINRTEHPYYAYNIVFELRKYKNEFYLEIYYNDYLKYNQTLNKFMNTLKNTKFSNLNYFCKSKKSNNTVFKKKIALPLLYHKNNIILVVIIICINIIIILYITIYLYRKSYNITIEAKKA